MADASLGAEDVVDPNDWMGVGPRSTASSSGSSTEICLLRDGTVEELPPAPRIEILIGNSSNYAVSIGKIAQPDAPRAPFSIPLRCVPPSMPSAQHLATNGAELELWTKWHETASRLIEEASRLRRARLEAGMLAVVNAAASAAAGACDSVKE